MLYLLYSHDSTLVDHRPEGFVTILAYHAPALPMPGLPNLAPCTCTRDINMIMKATHVRLDTWCSVHGTSSQQATPTIWTGKDMYCFCSRHTAHHIGTQHLQ